MIALEEVELVHFERVQFQLKNFDMVSFEEASSTKHIFKFLHLMIFELTFSITCHLSMMRLRLL